MRSSGQRLVEDDPVALVVINHRAPFVGVVVGALHDAAATFLHGLGRGVYVVGLDADHDLPGNGMVDRGRQCEGDGPAVEGGEVGAVAKLQRHAQGLAVEPDRLVQVVGRQDYHLYLLLAHPFPPAARRHRNRMSASVDEAMTTSKRQRVYAAVAWLAAGLAYLTLEGIAAAGFSPHFNFAPKFLTALRV